MLRLFLSAACHLHGACCSVEPGAQLSLQVWLLHLGGCGAWHEIEFGWIHWDRVNREFISERVLGFRYQGFDYSSRKTIAVELGGVNDELVPVYVLDHFLKIFVFLR